MPSRGIVTQGLEGTKLNQLPSLTTRTSVARGRSCLSSNAIGTPPMPAPKITILGTSYSIS